MLNVTRKELEKAYRHHRHSYGELSSHSHFLLLFYCAECGLKALLMDYNRVGRYDELPEDMQVGHDLRGALARLKAPATLTIRHAQTAHGRQPQQSVAANELHQAFRYGVRVEPQDEIIQDLQKIVTWLEEHLK